MKLNNEELKAALEWLKDCTWGDMDAEDFEELTGEEIERGIKRHWCGGIESFKATFND